MSTSVPKTRVTTALLVTIVSATSLAPVLHSSLDLDVKLVSGSVPIQYRYLSLPLRPGGTSTVAFTLCVQAPV